MDESQKRTFAAHLNQSILWPAESADKARLPQIQLISLPVPKASDLP